MIAAGADAQSVSMMAFVVNLVLSLVCCKAPALIERLGLGKSGAVLLAFVNAFAWVPLIFCFFLFKAEFSPVWFILFWLVNLLPSILLSTQRDHWLSGIIPHGTMGRYLGQRLAIRSAFYLGAFFLLGYLLDSFSGGTPVGFSVIFCVAFLAAAVNFLIYIFMSEPRTGAPVVALPKQADFKFRDFFRDVREVKLHNFVLFTSLFGVTVNICGPLYAVYMLKELHFSYFSFAIVISGEYLARVISVPFWGRFADRAGNIRALAIVTRVIAVLPICWLFASDIGWLVLIQMVSGFCWGAYDLCTQNYLFKMAPPHKKLGYIVYSKSLSLFCVALGGLLSIYLMKEGLPVFGSRILGIFMVSGIFRGLVVLYMMPKLIDLAVAYGRAAPPKPVDWENLKKQLVSQPGLYYYPDSWGKFLAAPVLRPARHDTLPAVFREGLYYNPAKWGSHIERKAEPARNSIFTAVKRADSGGLYYKSEAWSRYKRDSLKEILQDRLVTGGAGRYEKPCCLPAEA